MRSAYLFIFKDKLDPEFSEKKLQQEKNIYEESQIQLLIQCIKVLDRNSSNNWLKMETHQQKKENLQLIQYKLMSRFSYTGDKIN